ncbi:hypothetical protein J4414_02140 [Candidatus Woesearchaeota archaeon]|nr:hypothetical protein [Candidatus Woesearchaeota archaeon]
MNWTKIVFSLVVLLLYIPMVFMGANVFFPKYTGDHSYYESKCYGPRLSPEYNETEVQKCAEDEKDEREKFEDDKQAYESWKYFTITLFNLIALLFVIFIPLEGSIVAGIFLGSIITTFFATWIYFDTKSKFGFATIVLIFLLVIYLINKKKDTLFKFKN